MSRPRTLLSQAAPLLIALVVIAADRVSKLSIQNSLSFFDNISLISGWLRIIHTENPGAAFGVLANGNPWLRSGILIGVSGLVLVFVATALFGRRSTFTGMAARVGLSLVLGGAVGNLYDRIVHGTVTDFIEVYHGAWSFPAFNVADSAITVGAILLLFDLLHTRRREIPEPTGLAHNK